MNKFNLACTISLTSIISYQLGQSMVPVTPTKEPKACAKLTKHKDNSFPKQMIEVPKMKADRVLLKTPKAKISKDMRGEISKRYQKIRKFLCPANLAKVAESQPDGSAIKCYCTEAAAKTGIIWGTEVYTSDSSPCRAAVHAGLITKNGPITIYFFKGQPSYQSSDQNGFRSQYYAEYPRSFAFSPSPNFENYHQEKGEDSDTLYGIGTEVSDLTACPNSAAELIKRNENLTSHSCFCSERATNKGTVWGNGIYTSDSSICRAAKHAGFWNQDDELVTIFFQPGRETYESTKKNGVTSLGFGPWPNSFSLN